MNRKIIILIMWLLSLGASAQQVTTGIVTDRAGNPISGARVEATGTSFYTMTSIDGRFSLETPVIINKVHISSAGMKSVDTNVRSNMTVVLKEATRWNEQATYYHFFVSAQGTVVNSKMSDFPIGVMVGTVKDVGVYGRFQYSGCPSDDGEMDFTNHAYSAKSSHYFYNPNVNMYHDWTEYDTGYMSITGGVIFRLGSPLHLYLGTGYINRKVVVKDGDTGMTYKDTNTSISGMPLEVGLMLRMGHVVVNGGSSLIGKENGKVKFNAHFGIGYSF